MTTQSTAAASYNRFLLLVAGLGGLLYGIDVGIIAGALPYLEATSNFSAEQIGTVVAAVLLGSVLSSLFAGALADLFGRKSIMLLSALLFILSIPIICLSSSFYSLVAGRLLQGISGGLIGVVVPLYLAECLGASSRGKGTGMFQFLLTVGLVFAALIALYFGNQVEKLEMGGATADELFVAKNQAWRMIFWVSILPGIAFFIGGLFVSESPRWLFRKKRLDAARTALVRSSGPEAADLIMQEMAETEHTSTSATATSQGGGSLLQRKYVYPFLLAVVILACNQFTGINSVLAYSVKIFQQAGLAGVMGNYGDTVLKIVNCIMTVVAVILVDKAGRKFLLKMGTAGIIAGLVGAALLFLSIEGKRADVTTQVQQMVNPATATLKVDLANPSTLTTLGVTDPSGGERQLVVTYKRGSDGGTELANSLPLQLANGTTRPPVLEVAATKDPANKEPLNILKAEIGPRPSSTTGWLVTACFVLFIATYAAGPGVCVWLALSELMPNRIRSNGMSIALLINQGVSTTIAWIFLPVVGKFGYSTMFFVWAGVTVIYFITAAFFLPETKGKTLEEIEEYFEGKKSR